MPIRNKAAAGADDATRDVRAVLLMGVPGMSPTTDFSRSEQPMPGPGIAAALAVLPTNVDAPRVIQQFTSVFLVSRVGELWRVYDVENLDVGERRMPTSDSTVPYRVFIALARKAQMRVHTFAPDAPRDLDPVSVQAQLDASVAR